MCDLPRKEEELITIISCGHPVLVFVFFYVVFLLLWADLCVLSLISISVLCCTAALA